MNINMYTNIAMIVIALKRHMNNLRTSAKYFPNIKIIKLAPKFEIQSV